MGFASACRNDWAPPLHNGRRLFDFVLTCPPYFRLEKYSSLPEDLSNLDTYKAFVERYSAIIHETLDHLKEQHFACVVVGSYRDPNTPELHDLAADTRLSFQACGAKMFNKAILETAIGSAAARASR